ncbi:MAG: sulfatase-like hydrolase/transferase, partial [Planctomycetota bacterium]
MTRRVDRRPARAWLVAALALAACGDRPGVEPSGPSAVQIPLSVVEGDWPDADESVALTVEIADSGAAAIAQKAGLIARVVEPGDVPEIATRCVAVKPGKPPVVIEVPLEADLADFDLVRLRYATLGFLRVAAVVAVDSKETYRSEDAERNRTLDPETIEFDLSALDGRSGSIDRIELHFQEMTHQSAFFDLELVRRSAAARLPSPLQPPPHVAIGNGSREATGLLPGVVLGGPIDAPAAGSIAIEASAEERFGSAAAAEIRVALVEGGDQLAAKTFEVGAEWTTLTLPFERSRSEPVELRVTSETDGGALVGTARWLAAPEPDRAPRTVLFITSDTHRADYVGYADGGPGVRSPMIDSLAERGTRFENAVSATSITNPSHASMFTGLSVRDTGIVGNVVQLSERANTLAEAYREAGFRTFAAVSARHMIPWRSGFGQGFERYDAPARRAVRDGADTIDAVYAMLEDAGAHDVFLWLHLFEAHAPYRLHEDFTPLYYEGDPYSEELDELAPEAQAGWDRRIRDKEYVLALYRGEVTY